jgi:hypothetical protein
MMTEKLLYCRTGVIKEKRNSAMDPNLAMQEHSSYTVGWTVEPFLFSPSSNGGFN